MVDQNGEASVAFTLANYAEEANIKIKDSEGATVKTITKKGLEPGDHSLNIDKSGLDFDNQKYTFSVSATDGSNPVKSSPMMIGLVNSVRFNEKGSFLVMGNNEASFSNVLEIGTPK